MDEHDKRAREVWEQAHAVADGWPYGRAKDEAAAIIASALRAAVAAERERLRPYLFRIVALARAEPDLPTESVVFQAGQPKRQIAMPAPAQPELDHLVGDVWEKPGRRAVVTEIAMQTRLTFVEEAWSATWTAADAESVGWKRTGRGGAK